jgi:hypothetical protein
MSGRSKIAVVLSCGGCIGILIYLFLPHAANPPQSLGPEQSQKAAQSLTASNNETVEKTQVNNADWINHIEGRPSDGTNSEQDFSEFEGRSLETLLDAMKWTNLRDNVFPVLDVHLDLEIGHCQQRFDPHMLVEVLEVTVGSIEHESGFELLIDASSGEVRRYLSFAPIDTSESSSYSYDEKSARKIALDVIESMEVSEDIISSTIRNSYESIWEIGFERTYEGFKLQSRGINVSVERINGEVISIINKPPILPRTLHNDISETEAVEIALSFINEVTNARKENIEIWLTEQSICLTKDMWKKDILEPSIGPPVSRLVWIVGYRITEHGAYYVLVDCETGKTYAPYVGI